MFLISLKLKVQENRDINKAYSYKFYFIIVYFYYMFLEILHENISKKFVYANATSV